MDYVILGRILQESRIIAKLKQSEVAAIIGCTSANISSWERGKSKIDIDSFAMLCDIYKIDFTNTLKEASFINREDIKHNILLSEHEEQLILSYRKQPSMQEAVDRLLGVESITATKNEKLA